MFWNGYVHTGKRLFSAEYIVSMNLWATAGSAEITMDEGARIVLDEDETEILRRWADLSLQAGVVCAQDQVITMRCERQETLNRARKLNRAATRRQSREKKTTQASPTAPRPANVVDIDLWKRGRVSAEPILTPAA